MSNPSDSELRRNRRVDIELPTVPISVGLVRTIHAAVPEVVRQDVSWSASTPEGGEVSTDDLEAFLDAIAKEPQVARIHLFTDRTRKGSGYNLINLFFGPEHRTRLDCSFDVRNEVEFARFVYFVNGIFSENPPLTFSESEPPESVVDSEEADKSPFWSRLNWQRIVEDIISRVASNLIGYAVAGLAGIIIGYFIGRM